MAAKKTTVKKKPVKTSVKAKAKTAPQATTGSLLEYFRAGESYTSLVLGIIVVIIASVLLLSFFKTRPDTDSQKGTTSISTVAKSVATTPTPTLVQISGTLVNKADKATPTPTVAPTRAVTPTSAPTLTKAVEKPTPVKLPMDTKTYTIAPGDDLWAISVKIYGDGYKWVDIARANNLTDPGLIHVGNKLKLPAQKSPSLAASPSQTEVKATEPSETQVPAQPSSKITGNSYVIVKDDVLWDIAVRAYGDGYKWVDIARANNLSDPNLIFSGNSLKLPR